MKLSLQLTSFSLALFALSAPSLAQTQTDNPFGEIELPPAQPGQQGAQPAPQAQPQNAPQPPAPAMAPPPQQSAPPSSYNNNANSFELNGSGYGSGYGNQNGGVEANPQGSPKRSGLVFVPRLGLLLTGHANMHSDIKCPDAYQAASPFRPPVGGASSDDPFCNPLIAGAPEQDGSATDNSSILVGADLLYHVAPMLRIGGSALWSPATEVEIHTSNGPTPIRMGADVSLDLTLEHLYADNGSSALLYRVMAGPSLLLTGGDLENNEINEKKVCKDLFKVCEFGSGVYPGYNLGAGLGALIPVGGSSLRTDLLLNYVAVPFRTVSATVENQNTGKTFDASIDEDISFVRLWLSVGTEM